MKGDGGSGANLPWMVLFRTRRCCTGSRATPNRLIAIHPHHHHHHFVASLGSHWFWFVFLRYTKELIQSLLLALPPILIDLDQMHISLGSTRGHWIITTKLQKLGIIQRQINIKIQRHIRRKQHIPEPLPLIHDIKLRKNLITDTCAVGHIRYFHDFLDLVVDRTDTVFLDIRVLGHDPCDSGCRK